MLSPISLFVAGFGLGGGLIGYISHLIGKRAQQRITNRATQDKQALQEEIVLQKTLAFDALFGTFFGGAATLDDQGRILHSNHSLHERLGYGVSELRGRSLLTIIHPEDLKPLQDFLQRLVGSKNASAPRFSRELRCYTQEGKVVWVHLSLSVLQDTNLSLESQSLRLLAMMDDVTRRRQAEGVVARLSSGVHELYRLIADQQSDFESQMNAVLNLGCNLFDVRTGLLGKINGDQLEIKTVISPNKGLRMGSCYEMGSANKRLELPTPLCCNKARDWRERPFIAVTQDETFLGAPIYVAGQLSGVLSFSDTASRGTPFEAEQTQFCQLMALWIGSEIERRERQTQKAHKEATLLQDNARLEAMATQDGLTGLKNRRAFDEKLGAEFKRASAGVVPLSLLLMDVDKFKPFNDTFGHPAGDEVLKKVARLLQDNVRKGGFVARYGGEEFVVVLPDTAIEDALLTAERLRSSIESAHWTHREITISIGAACWNKGITTPAQLLSTADGALYQSKTDGRNRVTQAMPLHQTAQLLH